MELSHMGCPSGGYRLTSQLQDLTPCTRDTCPWGEQAPQTGLCRPLL